MFTFRVHPPLRDRDPDVPKGARLSAVRYAVAVLAVLLAVLLKLLLDPVVGPGSPFLLFFAAVMVSAWYGGLGPGLLATFLSALFSDFLFLIPYQSSVFGPGRLGANLQLGIFLFEAALITWFTRSLQSAWRQADGLIREKQESLDRERAAHAAARAAEQRYRDLVDGVDAIVWEADPHSWQYTFVSQRAEPLLGYPIARWLAEPGFWVQLLHPDDRERAVRLCRDAAAAGRDHELEYRAVAADGRVVWLRDLMYVVRGGDGRARQLRGLMVDVTERRLLEEALRQRADELAEVGRRKDEFLAMLAHELRNPLAPLRNAAHLLRLGELPEAALVEARGVIERQIQHLARLVDDLLDAFRLTHRKIVLDRERLDLAELVRVTVADHRPTLESAGLTLTLELPAGPVWVMGDRVRLAQVVSNLLHNAAKFTDPGGRVAVAVPADARDGRAAVSVRDTGIGIEPQLLPHVFETFIQADRTLDRSRGGLGLGLALVKGLVELQGGAVQASSPGLGQGSEFRFWLPLDEEAPAPGGGSSPGAAAPARCLRVLVVEDHRDTARTLRVLLTRYGHEVELAHTGAAGVEVARRWRPDVVLSDLGLPELDGYQVARTLRRDPVTASVCLIAVSGYGQDEDRRRCREAGFDLHLTKPVDPVELQRLLAGVVVEPRRPDPAAAGGPAPGLPEEKAGGEPASLDLLAHQGASSSLPAELHLRREAESG